jgi:hypothetical protein
VHTHVLEMGCFHLAMGGGWSCFVSFRFDHRLHQLLPTFTVHAGGRRNSIYSNPRGVDDVQKYTPSTKYTRAVVGMNATIMTNPIERFIDTNIIDRVFGWFRWYVQLCIRVCVCVGVRHTTPLLCNVGLHAKGNQQNKLALNLFVSK